MGQSERIRVWMRPCDSSVRPTRAEVASSIGCSKRIESGGRFSFPPDFFHSYLKATIGSTLVARRAGM